MLGDRDATLSLCWYGRCDIWELGGLLSRLVLPGGGSCSLPCGREPPFTHTGLRAFFPSFLSPHPPSPPVQIHIHVLGPSLKFYFLFELVL